MFNMKQFADFLAAKRKEKGLTQDQLSDLVGVTHQAVSKWERGEAMPEISKIGDLAKSLGVQTDEVVTSMYTGGVPGSGTGKRDADAEYYALADKSSVGDMYYLAPDLSKETLRIAIDTVISAKGTRGASMLFQFADEEYLRALGYMLLSGGDTGLVEYADEKAIKRAVVNFITAADLRPDRGGLEEYYRKAGETLIYSKDEDFINETFRHAVDATGNWNVWRHIISRFPPDVLVKQGIRHMVSQGPSSFNGWWGLVGRRVAARMFLGYADHFQDNAQAWRDIALYYEQSDKTMMESAIKERIDRCDPNVFRPLLRTLGEETQKLLYEKGLQDTAPAAGAPAESYGGGANQFRQYGKSGVFVSMRNIYGAIAEIEGRLTDLEGSIEELESRVEELESRADVCEELGDRLGELENELDKERLENKLVDLENKLDELENQIEGLDA